MGVPISNVTRRVVYSASGTGPYNFTFEILANTDVAVYKDDALLTLTTDYTVTINANGTGYITLVASPTGATQIAIVGNRTIQRTTDFVTGGDFFANTVNDEMDQQTIFAQQNAEAIDRALKAPQTDPTSINMTLPRASVRANKTLAFDTNGNPTTGEVIGDNRGNWAAGTAYNKRDIVKDTSNGNVYYANTAHTSTGSQPISTNADSAKWDLIVDNASAGASATAAAASASAAATSASNASTSATNAASSASTASTQASNASTSATNAANSATAAASSASTASTQASNAATSATNAANSATSASNSASSASTSATNASNSATSAATSASQASTSASNAASSASTATTQASNAATSATNAANSATASANSATAAAASAAAAAASFDAFDDIYLGAKSSDPSVDNDGNALTTGDQYFNTSANELRVYNGSTWQAASTVGGTVTSLNVTGATTLGQNPTLSAGTANGVAYLNGSKVLTTGSALVFDGSNLGLGVTPSAWTGTFKALQIGAQGGLSATSTGTFLSANWYTDGTNRYIGTGNATLYQQINGQHAFYTAPSGTAGNAISFTQAMTLDASGNLGIGTTSPAGRLHARFDAGAGDGFTGKFIFQTTDQRLTIGTYWQSGVGQNARIQSSTDSGVAQNLLLNPDGGNVGIGTSSPAAKLDVAGTSRIRTDVSSATVIATATNAAANAYATYRIDSNDYQFYTTGSEKMRIDSSGNVGIGTSSPSTKLHVYGGNATVQSNTSGDGNIRLTNTGAGYLIGMLGAAGSTALSFYDTVAGAERARIDSSGNLLVGTTSPEAGSRFRVVTSGSTGSTWGYYITNSAGSILTAVLNNGRFFTGGAAESPYNLTTASAANCFIGSDNGILMRSTSSIKYKTDVQNAAHGLAEVMTLRPVTYKGKNDGDKVFGGLIAEEVHEAGLTEFVQYAEDGTPDALAYGNMVSLCIKAIQEQQAIIEQLKADVAALKGA